MSDVEQPGGMFEAPHPNGAVHQNGKERARLIRLRLIVLAMVALGAVWVFAIVWSVTVTTHSPERLAVADAQSVVGVCSDAQQQLRALPLPYPKLGADRVTRLRAENTILRAMTARFGDTRPSSSTPAAALAGWSADWNRLIDARTRYADQLAAAANDLSKKVKFVVPATGGVKPITERMDDFVRENHPDLDACFTTALQAEIVEGPRAYEKVTQ